MRRVWKRVKSEGGQVLVLVLLLLLIGGLLLPPLLSLSMTSLSTGQMYEANTGEVYSADSGLAHALWQIKYGDLASTFTSPSYEIYDFNTEWSYYLSESLNDKNVDISLENVWIPLDIDRPDTPFEIQEARDIIELGKLIVIGSVSGTSTCQINIVFYPDAGEELDIETLGIWLSPGFQYVADSSSFGQPTTQPHAGGQVLLWDFDSTPFIDFPGVDPGTSELRSTITFEFVASQENTAPATVSWVTTSGVSGVSYSWDANSKVYHLTSIAGNTRVESYNIKSEVRKLGSSVSGDYRAIGNSLMLDENWDFGGPKRDTLLAESSATVSDIPSDATVAAAYLYWSGWFDGVDDGSGQIIWEDDCSDMGNWNGAGPHWGPYFGRFRWRYTGGETDRYLVKSSSLDLSGYTGEEVVVSWDQQETGWLEDDDRLYFSLSHDGGNTWSDDIEAFRGNNPPENFSYIIPEEYLTAGFKVRFTGQGFAGTGESCLIDNIVVYVSPIMFRHGCDDFDNWVAGADWNVVSGRYRGHHVGS
ncbi:MAG: hypothetical protein JSV77_01610 [Dehalococcoidales bacterium]|nr:MAG: hypothetical protein JSV77_01610 [Dehalococcoidales bacterium]